MKPICTKLNDRTLWHDGDSTIHNMDFFYEKILNSEDISEFYVEEITPEIKFYNKNVENKLKVKQTFSSLSFEWNIPEEYKSLELKKFILRKLEDEILSNQFTDIEIEKRIERVETEFKLWEFHNLTDLLKTLIYIVDQFKANGIVWGTGRGSSCCCYILYLVGLHDVDCVYYNLDTSDFFRDG